MRRRLKLSAAHDVGSRTILPTRAAIVGASERQKLVSQRDAGGHRAECMPVASGNPSAGPHQLFSCWIIDSMEAPSLIQELRHRLQVRPEIATYLNTVDDRRLLETLSEHLVASSAALGEPRQVFINKSGAGAKRRVFIFPPLDDLLLRFLNRFCQEYSLLPASDSAFAFIRGRGVKSAICEAVGVNKTSTILRTDFRDFFCSVSLTPIRLALPNLLARDKLLGELISNYIAMGEALRAGVLPGSPVAGLFANFALRGFDAEIRSKVPIYLRYADDCLLAYQEGHYSLRQFEQSASHFGLSLNREKVATHSGHSFDFLGFSFNEGNVLVSDHALKKAKNRVRRIVRYHSRGRAPRQELVRRAVAHINVFLYGSTRSTKFSWWRHYGIVTSPERLRELDSYIHARLAWLGTGRNTRTALGKISRRMLRASGLCFLEERWNADPRSTRFRSTLGQHSRHNVS